MLKLSIVVPVYNVEAYLPKCLDSLIDEAYFQSYEIIAVDDGSTDASGAIADSYAEKYPSLIRVIHTENHGLGHARNLGAENSDAEYIAFIDSDDYLAPGAVGEFFVMLASEADICIFDARSVREDGSEIKYICGSKSELTKLDDYPELLLDIPNAWNKLYRRSLFTEIRFPDRAWFEDLRTVLKLYCVAESIRYFPLPLYNYVQHQNTITRAKKPDRNVEMIDTIDDLATFFKAHGVYERYYDIFEYLAFYSQFLTSSVRANLAMWNTPVQERLIDDFLEKFPDFQTNPYIKNMSSKHKLLMRLFLKKNYLAVHALMKLNAKLKGTDF